MAIQPKMTAEEKRWRADSDAHALMSAKLIESDPARMKAAVNAAKKLSKQEDKEANAMRAVAKKALSKVRKAKSK